MVSTAGGAQAQVPVTVPDVLPPGAKAGPWVVERELGRGGMGAVYAVVHEEIGKRAALKVVHQRLLVPGFNTERILLEAKVVNQVGHPNIVDIFEAGTLEDGRPYIVMERLEGQALSFRADEGKILADQVIDILLQVCDALVAAHAAGIIHRDLKLDNIFLVDNPEDPSHPRVKLLDWGIAKVINHDVRHTVEGQLVGTPQYLSPEQARGADVTPQTDVYSLGVMAYELFLEQLPFEAETSAEIMTMHLRVPPPPPSEIWPDVPPQLEELLLAMLAKAADQRPTVLEVARRLEAVRAELQRRRHAMVEQQQAVVSLPSEAPRAIRLISSAGLAPTELASIASDSRRWQYVVGALALAASALMFVFSRVGDTQAAAAATAPVHEAEVTAERAVPAPPPDRVAADPMPNAAPVPTAVADAASPASAGARIIPISAPAPTSRVSTRRTATAAARHVPSRTSPASPRREKRIDPDGTVDPY